MREDATLSDYYALFTYIGFGGCIDQERVQPVLKGIMNLLKQKHGDNDYRVKYLRSCLLKAETREFDIEDREWIRYILHAEVYPDDGHNSLLEDLKEKMEVSLCSEPPTKETTQK